MHAIETTVPVPLDQAEAAIRAALADQGFGVLTEIDVAATLKAKLGVERPALKILGACNPTFAHQALELDPSSALVLPCNVVLEPGTDGGTRISVVDPRADARSGVRRARRRGGHQAHRRPTRGERLRRRQDHGLLQDGRHPTRSQGAHPRASRPDAVAGRHFGRAQADSAAVTGGWSLGHTGDGTVGPRRE